MSENTALALIDKATMALAKAEKLSDVSAIRSHAKVFQAHAKEFRLGREAILTGIKVQLLAELKAGALAIQLAKSDGYKKMLEESRLTTDQVSKWRREAENVSKRSDEDIFLSLTKLVDEYIQTVRTDPDAANADALPSFRGFLLFLEGEKSEQHQKEPRTELTKQFCSFMEFEKAEREIKHWLQDKGRSKDDREEIQKMWDKIKEMGNLFMNQTANEGE
jgi:hypothetical protein